MTPKPWRTISSRIAYQNPWLQLREDVAEMPDGRTTLYGVVECGEAVGVLPFVDDDHVVMVRQYRYVFGEGHRWEMPTGGVKPGESLVEAARREMREETGYDVGRLERVLTYQTSKSVMHEIAHLFIGRDLAPVQAMPDETEFMEVAVLPFARVLEQVLSSEIRDSMTITAVLLAARGRPG